MAPDIYSTDRLASAAQRVDGRHGLIHTFILVSKWIKYFKEKHICKPTKVES